MTDHPLEGEINRHADAVTKLKYFLTAGSGAALAFSVVHSTNDQSTGITDLLWVFSVILWGLSFGLGLLTIEQSNLATRKSIQLGQVEGFSLSANEKKALVDKVHSMMRAADSRSLKAYRFQKYCLILGAVSYATLAILERLGIEHNFFSQLF